MLGSNMDSTENFKSREYLDSSTAKKVDLRNSHGMKDRYDTQLLKLEGAETAKRIIIPQLPYNKLNMESFDRREVLKNNSSFKPFDDGGDVQSSIASQQIL